MNRIAAICLSTILALTVCVGGGFGADYARMSVTTVGGGVPAAGGGGDSCTGGLLLSAHCENANVETGTPAGCSTNATKSFTFNDSMAVSTTQVSDGTYSFYKSSTSSYQGASIPTDVSKTAGTLVFDLYIAAHHSWGRVVQFHVDDNNYLRIEMGSESGELYFLYKGNTAQVFVNQTCSAGSWITVTAKYRTGATDPSLSLSCGGAAATTNDNLTEIVGTPSTMMIGDTSGSWTHGFYIDKLKLYDSWQ